jgi:cyanate permease
VAIDATLTNWFVRKRGIAFSVKWGIISLIGAATLPFLSWMIEAHGWRVTSFIWGLLILAGTPPLLNFVKQKRPEYYGFLPDGAALKQGTETNEDVMVATGRKYAADISETEYTFKQAARTSSYWMITLGWMIMSVLFAGLNVHIVPFLTDKGINPVIAGSMFAMWLFFTLPSRIFGGLIADRTKREHIKFLLAGSLFLSATAVTILLLSPTIAGIYVFLALYGLGFGAYTPLDTLIRGRYFGRKAYGSIQGVSTLLSGPFAFLAPIYTGWVYDKTGTYVTAFTFLAVLAAVGCFIMCLVRTPKPLSVY